MQIRPDRAISLLVCLTIISIVAAVTVLLWNYRHKQLAHALDETQSLARILAEQTEQMMDGVDMTLLGTQERMQTPLGFQLPLDSASVRLLLGAKAFGMHQLNSLFLVDANGMVVNSSREQPPEHVSVAEREYYRHFVQDNGDTLFIGKPVRRLKSKTWTIHLARRIADSAGHFRGVIVASMELESLEQGYQRMTIDYARPSALYSAEGALITSYPRRGNEIGEFARELKGISLPLKANEPKVFNLVADNGKDLFFALAEVPKYPFLIGVIDDREESLASWRETAIPIAMGAGLVCFFIAGVAFMLVRRLRQEEVLKLALREAGEHFQRTVESVMDAIVAINDEQNITLFNPAAERMFGYAADDILGTPLERLIPHRFRQGHRQHVERFRTTDGSSRAMAPYRELTGVRADGTEFPIESTISQTQVAGRRQMTAVFRDISESRRAEFELREANQQLRALSASLQNVREAERSRISLELHDDLGQRLSGLKLDFAWLKGRLKSGHLPDHSEVDAMRIQLDEAIASVRRISAELRPVILDDLGFCAAVSWLAEDVSRRSGLVITTDLPAAGMVVNDELATALFRIVQESLTNIVRHANATAANIHLAVFENELCLTISDNGHGFDVNNRKNGTIGLVSMRERATMFGGSLDIVSTSGEGTTIKVTLPATAETDVGENENT